MYIVQLEMMLAVVVRLIVVVMDVSGIVIVFTCHVVLSVGIVDVYRASLPCDPCML